MATVRLVVEALVVVSPVKVGVAVIVIAGVSPPDEDKFPEAVTEVTNIWVDDPVPPLRTGKIPDTSEPKATALKVALPEALPCRTVTVVPWFTTPTEAPVRVMGAVTDMAACLAFQVAALAMRPSAGVPVQEGLKVQVEVAQTILSKMLVSVVVEKVIEGE